MADIHRFTTADAPAERLREIRGLLDEAFEGRFSDDDWEHTLGGWHALVTHDDTALAHAAVVPRVLEVANRPLRAGYVEGVATKPSRQREGFGALAMDAISEHLRHEFEIGALATSAVPFYARLGWERWQGPTSVRHGSELVRTEEEDGGIMVLRFGASAAVDLASSISCEARRGDDW